MNHEYVVDLSNHRLEKACDQLDQAELLLKDGENMTEVSTGHIMPFSTQSEDYWR